VLWRRWFRHKAAPRPVDAPVLPEPAEAGLVPLYVDTLAGAPGFTVSARDLHRFLGVSKHYATWIKDKVEQLVLQAGIDFARCMGDSEQGSGRLVEVCLALEAGKEIAAAQASPESRTLYRWRTEAAARPASGGRFGVGADARGAKPGASHPDQALLPGLPGGLPRRGKTGKLPKWDDEAEQQIADGFAYPATEHRRWVLSFDGATSSCGASPLTPTSPPPRRFQESCASLSAGNQYDIGAIADVDGRCGNDLDTESANGF